MSCDLSRTLLHGYLDGELDAAGAAEFERHLETCRECVAALDIQETLRRSIRGAELSERAPSSLHEKIQGIVRAPAAGAASSRIAAWQWLAAAATLFLILGLSEFVFPQFRGTSGEPSSLAVAEIVDAHIRSLQPGHLTDVASTDQHTVKPWFDGKLDFAPPVRDFSEEGFPLVGGRLDVINGKTVAALVYGRRKHFINVFVWPTEEQGTSMQPPGSVQGYQWVYWRHQGMEFCAVSDTSASDLHELAQLFTK